MVARLRPVALRDGALRRGRRALRRRVEPSAGRRRSAKDKVLDWWASALERHAQTSTGERDRIFARMYDRAWTRSCSASRARSRPTTGLSRPRARWASSIAHGTRPWPDGCGRSMAGSRADALRTDIDRLVLTGIIPDRARAAAARRPQPAPGGRHDGHRVGAVQAGMGDAAQHDRGTRAIPQ